LSVALPPNPDLSCPVGVRGFVRRSGTRESIHLLARPSPPPCRRRVSPSTLCPLGLPKKAIGLESPIEPWWPCFAADCLTSFRNRRPLFRLKHEEARIRKSCWPIHEASARAIPSSRSRHDRDSSQGLEAMRKTRPPVGGETFLLTSPVIEPVGLSHRIAATAWETVRSRLIAATRLSSLVAVI